MIRFYDTIVQNQSRRIGVALPFVVLIQIGSFFEAYRDGAKTLNAALGLKLKGEGVTQTVTAGFPVCAASKYIGRLTQQGYGVLRIVQMENTITKQRRLATNPSSVAMTKRTILPMDTAALFTEQSLAIVQGSTCLVYLVNQHAFVETLDSVIETLMQYTPIEILMAKDCKGHQSIGTMFPGSVIRTQFPPCSTALDTLLLYLKVTSRSQKRLSRLNQVPSKLHMDTRTIMNLTLFGKSTGSLLGALDCCKTQQGREILRSRLYSPIKDLSDLTTKQDQLKSLLSNQYLDILWTQMPSTLSIGSHCHTVYKTSPETITQTAVSVAKWTHCIHNVYDEINQWRTWDRLLCETMGLVPPKCIEIPLLHVQQFEYDRSGLEKYQETLGFKCTWGSSVKTMNFLETSSKNHSLVQQLPFPAIISQTKTTIRFDTRDLQRLRLAYIEAELSHQVVSTCIIQCWLQNFQSTHSATEFEEYAQNDCLVSIAYWFLKTTNCWCWPTFREASATIRASNISLPQSMSHGKPLIGNDINTRQTVLYGHNGSGKSTYMKACGINLLLAHCGLPVFADSFQTPVCDALFMRFGSNDCLAEGKSSFDVEMEHVHTIARTATHKSVVLCDELGCSCDALSGQKLCNWFLHQFLQIDCFLVFATHFDIEAIGIVFKEMGSCPSFRIQDTGTTLKLKKTNSVMKLMMEAGLPPDVINYASKLKLKQETKL